MLTFKQEAQKEYSTQETEEVACGRLNMSTNSDKKLPSKGIIESIIPGIWPALGLSLTLMTVPEPRHYKVFHLFCPSGTLPWDHLEKKLV